METLLALGIFAILSLSIITGLIVAARQGELTWATREALDLAVSRLEVERYNSPPLLAITSNVYTIIYNEDKNAVYKTASVNVTWERYGAQQTVALSRVITK